MTTATKTSFTDFWNDNDARQLWIVTTGIPTGLTLQHNLDGHDEDYCNLGELLDEEQFDWLSELTGFVVDGQWQWDGTGSPTYLTNGVLNVKCN